MLPLEDGDACGQIGVPHGLGLGLEPIEDGGADNEIDQGCNNIR